jgi:selenocysteine lyase/cysteine desulfurase
MNLASIFLIIFLVLCVFDDIEWQADAQLSLCQSNCVSSDRLTGPTKMLETRQHPWAIAAFPTKQSGFCSLGCQLFYNEVPKDTKDTLQLFLSLQNHRRVQRSGRLDDLRLKLQSHGKRVRVVSVTWIPTNGGIIDCAVEIGQMCKQYAPHAVYLLDACQAVGHICVDVEKLHCDVLTATGRKFLRGPRGTGFLYMRESSLSKLGEPITIDHFAATLDPDGAGYTIPPSGRRFEQWERNVAGMLGLGAAVDYLMKNVEINWAEQRIRSLAQDLRQRLTAIPAVTVRDLGNAANQCGIVTFTVGNVDADEVKASLLRQHVYVSVCPPASTPTDSSNRVLPALVRASLHCFNTTEESIRLCTLLLDIVESNVLVDVPSGKSS